MDKRRIEITDKRARDEAAQAAQAQAEAESEQLVDLGENQVHVDVPEHDEELDSPVGAEHCSARAGDRHAQERAEQCSAPTEDPASSTPPEDPEHFRVKASEYLELAQRKEAELRNYIRRVQQDLDDARRYAIESLLESLFPALDGLAQAASTYKNKPAGEDPLLDGVRGTIRALEGALLKNGIQKINECPAPYDPELHQALNVEESEDTTEDTVTEIYVEGYRLGDKILKPAMVKVLKSSS